MSFHWWAQLSIHDRILAAPEVLTKGRIILPSPHDPVQIAWTIEHESWFDERKFRQTGYEYICWAYATRQNTPKWSVDTAILHMTNQPSVSVDEEGNLVCNQGRARWELRRPLPEDPWCEDDIEDYREFFIA